MQLWIRARGVGHGKAWRQTRDLQQEQCARPASELSEDLSAIVNLFVAKNNGRRAGENNQSRTQGDGCVAEANRNQVPETAGTAAGTVCGQLISGQLIPDK